MEFKKDEELNLLKNLLELYIEKGKNSNRIELAKNMLYRINQRFTPANEPDKYKYLKGLSEKTMSFFDEYSKLTGKNIYQSIHAVLNLKPEYRERELLNYYKKKHPEIIIKYEIELIEMIRYALNRNKKQ